MEGQFNGMVSAAANLPLRGEEGNYTAEMFLKDFPQFTNVGTETKDSLIPGEMLQLFIGNANKSILPSRYCEIWRYAAGLFTAHYSALYLKTYSNGSISAARAAAASQQTGLVKAAEMGDTSITYDNAAITAATEKWGSWNATQYGQQLVSMARMIGMGGMYVI